MQSALIYIKVGILNELCPSQGRQAIERIPAPVPVGLLDKTEEPQVLAGRTSNRYELEGPLAAGRNASARVRFGMRSENLSPHVLRCVRNFRAHVGCLIVVISDLKESCPEAG